MHKIMVGVGLIKGFLNSGLVVRLLHIRQVECKVNSQQSLWLQTIHSAQTWYVVCMLICDASEQ